MIAQLATALVGGASRVYVQVGPLHTYEAVSTLLIWAFILASIRLVLQLLVSFLPARIAADLQAQLRIDLLTGFTRASWAVQSHDREGHLQEIASNQVGIATEGALQATTMLIALISLFTLLIAALMLNVTATLVVLTASAALFALLRPLSTMGSRHGHALSQAFVDYAGGISEAVRLAEETQVFGVAAVQRERITELVARVRNLFFRTQLLIRLVQGLYQSAIYLIAIGGLAAVYAAGATHISSLGAIVLLLVRAGTYGQQVQGSYQFVRQTLPYLERAQETQRRYNASSSVRKTLGITKVDALAFEDVGYAYESRRPVLSGVSFQIRGGEAIGIVGPSGAGKSTLIQIILGLRAPCQGRYLVNGLPSSEFASADWHRLFAYVPQEPQLLYASVADNIRFLRQLDDDVVQRGARLAGIHGDIMKWPDGYDTLVGPRADAVSGGQQQRICLARALAGKPEVLVLDEPTSALDPHSESLIQDSLKTLRGELTLFIVAHRMSTLQMCERVVVIVDGRLEAFDTVHRLQLDSSYYRSASALAAGASATSS